MVKRKVNFQKKLFIYLAIAIGLIGLLYYFKNQFVVAWVDGRPISRASYVAEMEQLAKKQALDSLITKQLILKEAAKQKVSVSEDELNQAMQQIEDRAKAQGSSLDEILTTQGLSRVAVRQEVRLQKLLEKMVGDIAVTDEQIQNYWDSNKAMFPGQTLDQVKDQITNQLKQQDLMNKVQELISRLQSQAKIVKWLQ